MQLLFAVTITVGAALLFLVQPMFARMVLPMLGGAPSVWNTSMVFYQAALLAGYGYVHFVTRKLPLRRQMILHGVLLLVPLVVLPIAMPSAWKPPTQSNPIPWLLGVMTVAVGLPFFVVSTTSPLLQKWFAASGHERGKDPYFLYAASNFGSMVGLLAYPLVLEPLMRVKNQSGLWAAGYGVLVCLTAGCALLLWRVGKTMSSASVPLATSENNLETQARGSRYQNAETEAVESFTWKRRLRWTLLAFAPSSLMLSVTTFLTSDIAAVPMLWVIPLAIYLLSFILVFARRPVVPHGWMTNSLPVLVLVLTVLFGMRVKEPVTWIGGLHLLVLLVAAMACHGELVKDRPSPSHLTEFYLWISVGGVLGGIFNALVAPLVFNSVAEYPITLTLVCALAAAGKFLSDERRQRLLDLALPLILGAVAMAIYPLLSKAGVTSPAWILGLNAGIPALLCLLFWKRRLRLALGIGVLFFVNASLPGESERLFFAERSFFGIHRVSIEPNGKYLRLYHGTIVHGIQFLDETRRGEPLGYYHRNGPIGQTFAALDGALKPKRVAVIGLGCGAITAYAEPQQKWTYYEIDPVVEKIARDARYFTYLKDCKAPCNVVLGDARLSLAATDEKYDVLIVDAYSSDSIPLHLITREAVALYLSRLTENGVLAFHISNRHLNLQPVVAALTNDAKLSCWIEDQLTTPEERAEGHWTSTWAVAARNPSALGSITSDPRWQRIQATEGQAVWTDDFASIFSVFKWK